MAGPMRFATARASVGISAPRARVWRYASRLAALPEWVEGVKSTAFLTRERRGVGAARLITFDGGTRVEEHVVAWVPGESFSYAATSGLPLRSYVASISLGRSAGKTRVVWQSCMADDRMTRAGLERFAASMARFYRASLATLRTRLE